ncbi:beta-glucosidase 22-like isoform X1 [Oryza brachyantha]|uniref:beta-glucosidase 22-like isoform X1 n=1 Tax=Oryza brachyantha TaxID=4533 RepID=UPI001ADA0854|nr:beta-glucosidase 22-like isoform X1 [Oryza brachyantha]
MATCSSSANSTGWLLSLFFFFFFLLLLLILPAPPVAPWRSGSGEVAAAARALNFTRQDFPRDFVFGAGTSAYQYEGATDEDGRTQSIWDTFTHAGRMSDKSTGDQAAGGYHKYKEDVKLMSDTGLEAYRFSISWSRLIPRGRGSINPNGLEYYNNLIDELVSRGIEIHVTLYQLDFPQILEDEYHGWLSPRAIQDFTAYADVCFREFGDRVRHWTTLDEPNVIALAAYDGGGFPPCRCSPPFGANCTAGDSTVEPYVVAHNLILAHASAVRLYRDKYQVKQKGVVGINLYSYWSYPFSPSSADIQATQRVLDFTIGWILDPLVYGDYPEIMKKRAGSRIPSFTKEQSELIRGSVDFIGINHYTSVYIGDGSSREKTNLRDYKADMAVKFRVLRNDTPSDKLLTEPKGLQCMLEYLRDAYQAIPVYVQENGSGQPSKDDSLNDTERVEYLSLYMGSTLAALRNGANVKGYFVWSFLDVFELLAGYRTRFGLHFVSFEDPSLPRQPKLSAHWYSKFLKSEIGINIGNMISPDEDDEHADI